MNDLGTWLIRWALGAAAAAVIGYAVHAGMNRLSMSAQRRMLLGVGVALSIFMAVVLIIGIPASVENRRIEEAQDSVRFGNASRDAGAYDTALWRYGQAITALPDYADAYRQRAVTYGLMGAFDNALVDAERAITLSTQDVEESAASYVTRGQIYTLLQFYNEALADFTHSHTLVPNFPPAYREQGRLHDQFGQYPEALAQYELYILWIGGDSLADPAVLARVSELKSG